VKLQDAGGTSFELWAERYQFPNATEYWDANWLMVRGVVEHPSGSWRFFDPCLTTAELGSLARWLDSVALQVPSEPVCLFTEPNLRFELLAEPEPAIHVTFSHESAPDWIADSEARLEGTTLRFPISANDLSQAARDLRADLEHFPVRGIHDP